MSDHHHHPPDLPGLRSLADARGKHFWRGLNELVETDEFQELVRREFPDDVDTWTDPVTRRRFLMLMGASFALAGLSGCSPQAPVGRIMPYVRQPEELIPGKPLFFATAMTRRGMATGLLVKSNEGRPIKVEGNVNHPASLGATDRFAQASVLGLYDPDRSQTITFRGQPSGWSAALTALRSALAAMQGDNGAGVRILTETVTSPTLFEQLAGSQLGSIARRFPAAKWYQYDPARSDAANEGARLALGQYAQTLYDFSKADVIVSLDSDFLSSPVAGVRSIRDFTNRRRVAGRAPDAPMNRLYIAETMPSITGAKADHRLPTRAQDVALLARALAGQLGVPRVAAAGTLSDEQRRWISAVADDLQKHLAASVVIAGEGQPAAVHALAHAMNAALGNVGATVTYIDPIEARPTNQTAALGELVQEINSGAVQVLFILGSNPVFTAPADLNFAGQLPKVPLRVHLGLYQDETAEQCHWHIPEAHYLEAWGDARAFDGTASIMQPLIAPLYQGRSASEFLSAVFEPAGRPGYDIVRDYWRANWPNRPVGIEFEQGWEQAVRDGVIAGTAFAPKTALGVRSDWVDDVREATPADPSALEITFQPDPTVDDGRYANNGWLQELPKPVTKITWDNAVFVSPKLAEQLGLSQKPGWSGGEHGEALVDMVELELHGRMVQGAAWILPGHANDSVTVQFGYGRTRAGKVGNGAGYNAYALRISTAPWIDAGLKIRKLDQRYTLACTQMHHSMQGREPVREGTYQEFVANPHFLHQRASPQEREAQEQLVPGAPPRPASSNHEHAPDPRLVPLTLYPGFDYAPPKNKWGMAIDLTACTGCSACVVACQAENNIPVVGKSEVTRGREMHWLRIDRYYEGDLHNPATYFQPVPCQQCENAPCELVCPVGATVHSADGLNDMVYNRCVGTRYCSNNCPYKVRRFNFLQFADFTNDTRKLGNNPDVTVRSRGVMEKCTYCVQRIRSAQIAAEIGGRPVRDGDVLTACQAACPAQAITFGDMNDPNSEVAKKKADPLSYGLLAELNTRPRTTYLAALHNPNPTLE